MKNNQGEPNSLPQSGKQLKALIFDLLYDQYRGVIIFIRIFEGELKIKQKIKFYRSQKVYQVEKVGVKTPSEVEKSHLVNGEIG